MENRSLAEGDISFCIDWKIFRQLVEGIHFEQLKNEASRKELVLFLGLAGSGKSACINYLLGANFVTVKMPGGKRNISLKPQAEVNIKYAEIGANDYQPHTLYAEIYRDASSNYCYCDTPAIFNSTTARCAEEVYGSFSAQLAVHSAESIKAVVVVIDWNIFTTTTATELKNLLYAISQIFPDLESVSGSLIFLINKAPKDITVRDFHENVVMFRESQKEKKLSLEKNIAIDIDDEFSRLVNEMTIIDLIENKCRECPQNIIMLDVFDEGKSRSGLKKALSKLQRPIPKRSFNFRNYNKNRELFEQEAQRNQNFVSDKILLELMSEFDVIGKKNSAKSMGLPLKTGKNDQNNFFNVLAILLKSLSVSLGIMGLITSIIGACAILNFSFAVSVVEKIFPEIAALNVFYVVIYGLVAMLASVLMYQTSYLLNCPAYVNDSTDLEDDSKINLISFSLSNNKFIEQLSLFNEAPKHLSKMYTKNDGVNTPEP